MDSHRVQIFHVANGDSRVVFIPHHLVLDLLVSPDALLDQHLTHRGQLQGIFHKSPKLLLTVRKPSPGSP